MLLKCCLLYLSLRQVRVEQWKCQERTLPVLLLGYLGGSPLLCLCHVMFDGVQKYENNTSYCSNHFFFYFYKWPFKLAEETNHDL